MTLINDVFFKAEKKLAFIVFDFETLTAYAKDLDAIELGAVILDIEKEEIKSPFSQLIRPRNITNFNNFTVELTGITRNDVKNSPPLERVLADFEDYCEKYSCILVAQNAYFDYSILKQNLEHTSKLLTLPCLDLIKLERFINPEENSYNLDTLAGFYNIKVDPSKRHRGLYDSELTAEVLKNTLTRLVELKVTKLSEIIKIGKINKFVPEAQMGLFG